MFIAGSTGSYSIRAVNSTAVDAIATGAVAIGAGTLASGNYSFASGFTTIASGIRSTTFGTTTTASGLASLAGGTNTIASSTNTFAFGSGNVASNTNSATLGGSGNTASAVGTVVLGGSGINGSVTNTVYVPSFNIGTVGTGTTTDLLVIESTGVVAKRTLDSLSKLVLKEIYISPAYGDTTGLSLYNWYVGVATDSTTSFAYFTGKLPDDLLTLVSVEYMAISSVTNATASTTVIIDSGLVGTANNTIHTSTNFDQAYTADYITEIDKTSLFSGLTAGSYFGTGIKNTTGDVVHMIGLKITYY